MSDIYPPIMRPLLFARSAGTHSMITATSTSGGRRSETDRRSVSPPWSRTVAGLKRRGPARIIASGLSGRRSRVQRGALPSCPSSLRPRERAE